MPRMTPAPPGPVDLSGLYAFYVEDDAMVRVSTMALFETLGLRFEAFASFAELEAALPTIERAPDLLISDYRLPDNRTAEHVVAAVKAAFDVSPPLIVVTGEMLPFKHADWLGRGRILRKPVSADTLIGEIATLCVEVAIAAARRTDPGPAAEPGSPDATPRSGAPSSEPL